MSDKQDEIRELNIDGREVKDAKVVSNVTGIGWKKESHKLWSKVIDQIGVIKEDEVHQGKNHTTVTLKAGTRVIIDDIRGRINPQYRVKDPNGKIWFVTANNVEFEADIQALEKEAQESNIKDKYIYRGGVRVDGTEEVELVLPKRYEIDKTTDQEIQEKKEQQ